jgi:hypothetical protein
MRRRTTAAPLDGLVGEIVGTLRAARGKAFRSPFAGQNLGEMAGVIRQRFPTYRGRSYGYDALAKSLGNIVQRDEGVPLKRVPLGKEAGNTIDGLPSRGNADRAVNPSSRLIMDGRSYRQGAEYFNSNERDLNAGPAPTYIRRMTTARNAGYVSPSQCASVAGGTGSLYIPHQRIPRHPITVSPFRRTVDVSSTIPARGIGAPVK